MQWESLMKLSRWLKLCCQKKILFLEPHSQMAGNRRYTLGGEVPALSGAHLVRPHGAELRLGRCTGLGCIVLCPSGRKGLRRGQMPSGHSRLVETILPHLALMMLMDEISFHFSAPGVNKADFTASKQQRKNQNNVYRLAVYQGAESSKEGREMSQQTPPV